MYRVFTQIGRQMRRTLLDGYTKIGHGLFGGWRCRYSRRVRQGGNNTRHRCGCSFRVFIVRFRSGMRGG